MKFNLHLKKYFFLLSILLFTSCDDIVSEKSNKNKLPERIFTQVHVIYKDSGKLKMDLKAPIIEQYQYEQIKGKKFFPKGVIVVFYKKNNTIQGYLKANLVEESEEDFYKAKGQVEIINMHGDTIKTDEIFWNQREKKIYTNALTQIHRVNGIQLTAKNGLEGYENFNDFKLKNIEGIIPINENESI